MRYVTISCRWLGRSSLSPRPYYPYPSYSITCCMSLIAYLLCPIFHTPYSILHTPYSCSPLYALHSSLYALRSPLSALHSTLYFGCSYSAQEQQGGEWRAKSRSTRGIHFAGNTTMERVTLDPVHATLISRTYSDSFPVQLPILSLNCVLR